MKKVIIAHIPVVHAGVIGFLNKYPDHLLFVLAPDVLDHLSEEPDEILSLQRDPRIMVDDCNKVLMLEVIKAARRGRCVRSLLLQNISLLGDCEEIVLPNEDVTRKFAKIFLSKFKGKIIFDQTFLRWDMNRSLSEVPPNCDRTITISELLEDDLDDFVHQAYEEAAKSSDWWRQIGAVMVRDKKIVITAYNNHMPNEYAPYQNGDPRSNFNAGEHVDICTADHAEATLVAKAARKGIVTEGADLFVTTFPCIPCAKLVAEAGFRKLYFIEGYSRLDSVEVLRSDGVEIIHVDLSAHEQPAGSMAQVK